MLGSATDVACASVMLLPSHGGPTHWSYEKHEPVRATARHREGERDHSLTLATEALSIVELCCDVDAC